MQHVQSGNNKAKGAQQQADADEAAQNWPGCFRHVARCRRLNKEEVVLILSNPAKFGLVRTEVLPAEGISSGTVYLCSKVKQRISTIEVSFFTFRRSHNCSSELSQLNITSTRVSKRRIVEVEKRVVRGVRNINDAFARAAAANCLPSCFPLITFWLHVGPGVVHLRSRG